MPPWPLSCTSDWALIFGLLSSILPADLALSEEACGGRSVSRNVQAYRRMLTLEVGEAQGAPGGLRVELQAA